MRSLLLSSSLLLILAGCVTSNPFQRVKTHKITLNTEFDPSKAAYVLEKGTATITGSASLSDQFGDTITCAGNNVFLVPVTEYSTERYQHLFGKNNNGFSSDEIIFHVKFKPDNPDFRKYMKVSTCNYIGEFTFDNVASGEYYLGTNIISEVEGYNTIEGGALAKKITIKDQQNIEVNLH